MAVLETVQDYVSQARILLQDTVQPYRYADADLVTALNFAFYEIARIRPDILIGLTLVQRATPQFDTNDAQTPNYSESYMTDLVYLPAQYRLACIYYICAHAQLRDTEDVQDERAAAFMNKFTSSMLMLPS
jgi:hypothetical protein